MLKRKKDERIRGIDANTRLSMALATLHLELLRRGRCSKANSLKLKVWRA